MVVEQEESRPGRPDPVFTRMTSGLAHGLFAPSTNKLDRVIAEKDVRVTQGERVIHGAQAVYTGATGLLELTGNPTATMPEGQITGAERLIWDRTRARFIGRGKFKSEWKQPEGQTNRLTAPLTRAK